MLNSLRKSNPNLRLHHCTDEAFRPLGKIIDGYDFSGLLRIMSRREIPKTGNQYLAQDEELQGDSIAKPLSAAFFGGMPIEIGFCNGQNQRLNALEYHKGSEIDVAVTDLCLLLADLRDIKENHILSEQLTAFYLPAGTAVELYATTLHFSPCRVTSQGFKSIVVLPKGTNLPLADRERPRCDEDRLLWMQNKWLIAHKGSPQAAQGAYIGIDGDNIEIYHL